ncbi:PrgI family protein [Candidatus Dojkabacteria bacterium]|nr:PrgI family protein [Candidatus Dojkabacteria bacterium]
MAQKQHVIPHNIVDVDFKLFGVMNLKQFIYVAIGGVLTYITFLMVKEGSIPAIIGWPAMVVFVVFGLSFGLLPVRGRSLDQWVLSYIAAVRSPTKRAWMKKGITPAAIPSTIPIEQLKPMQVKLGTQSTVGQIIGGLHIPTPEVDVKQVSLLKEPDSTQSVSIKEGRQTLLSPMHGTSGTEAQPAQPIVEPGAAQRSAPTIMQPQEEYQQARYEMMSSLPAEQIQPQKVQPQQIQPTQIQQPGQIPLEQIPTDQSQQPKQGELTQQPYSTVNPT